MAKDAQSSSPLEGGAPNIPLFGLPSAGASGLQGSPLDVVTGCFRDAVAWLKKEPDDDFAPAEFEAFVAIGVEFQQDGDVGGAVSKLRELNRDQERRRRKGVVRKLTGMLRRRCRATVVGGILAMLLNQLATQRANEALEAFGREIESLKRKADTRPPLTIERLTARLRGEYTSKGYQLNQLKLLAQHGYGGYGCSQTCDVCGQAAVGEMRGPGSQCLSVCHLHLQAAQRIIDDDKSFRESLVRKHQECLKKARQAFEEGIPELMEAQRLDPESPAVQNLKVAREYLVQIVKALAE